MARKFIWKKHDAGDDTYLTRDGRGKVIRIAGRSHSAAAWQSFYDEKRLGEFKTRRAAKDAVEESVMSY